jgi:uncharacterized protein
VKDGAVRRALKAVVRAFVLFDLRVHRAVLRLRGNAPFLLGGGCERCAACCETPAIRVGVLTWHLPTLRRAFLWWQRRVNGFELASSDFRRRTFTFTCSHFDRATRRCDSYASRPAMCRDYPRLLLEQPHPELMPGCGYRPVARDAKRRLRVLEAQPLTDEQRARLKRDLFLE